MNTANEVEDREHDKSYSGVGTMTKAIVGCGFYKLAWWWQVKAEQTDYTKLNMHIHNKEKHNVSRRRYDLNTEQTEGSITS